MTYFSFALPGTDSVSMLPEPAEPTPGAPEAKFQQAVKPDEESSSIPSLPAFGGGVVAGLAPRKSNVQ